MQRMLKTCEEIEQIVAQIYRYWQEAFINEPSLSALWSKMADDELDHVRQVQLAKRVVTEKVFEENGVSLESLVKSLGKARQLLKDVKEREISGEKALRAAIRIEEEFSKAHLLNAARVTDPSMKAMFQSLSRGDEQHIATLKNYCDSVLGNK